MDNQLNILHVDDSEQIIAMVADLLKNVANINPIKSATSIAEAQEIIQKEKIHVAILDIRFPSSNGITLLKWIKRNYPKICVIMLSNDSYKTHRMTSWGYGAEYFLDKTTEFEKLPGILAGIRI